MKIQLHLTTLVFILISSMLIYTSHGRSLANGRERSPKLERPTLADEDHAKTGHPGKLNETVGDNERPPRPEQSDRPENRTESDDENEPPKRPERPIKNGENASRPSRPFRPFGREEEGENPGRPVRPTVDSVRPERPDRPSENDEDEKPEVPEGEVDPTPSEVEVAGNAGERVARFARRRPGPRRPSQGISDERDVRPADQEDKPELGTAEVPVDEDKPVRPEHPKRPGFESESEECDDDDDDDGDDDEDDDNDVDDDASVSSSEEEEGDKTNTDSGEPDQRQFSRRRGGKRGDKQHPPRRHRCKPRPSGPPPSGRPPRPSGPPPSGRPPRPSREPASPPQDA